MQSLDSQLQSLRNQIEGMNGHGTIAPSQAYNKLPHFLPSERHSQRGVTHLVVGPHLHGIW